MTIIGAGKNNVSTEALSVDTLNSVTTLRHLADHTSNKKAFSLLFLVQQKANKFIIGFTISL